MERTDLERASSSEKEPVILTSLDQDAETLPVESVDNRSTCRWWKWFIPCSLFLLLVLGGASWIIHICDQKRYQCSAEAVPSPRPEPWCVAFNKKLSMEVAHADAGQGYGLLFYGDSITETWRGTDMGRPCRRCQGAPEVFDHYFGSKYKAEVLAVGGDQAAHLMWRLQNGQLYVHSQPRLIVVMIGTNDLGAASCSGAWGIKRSAKGAADRTLGALRLLREKNPGAHIIAFAVLPRGWTDAWHVYNWPSMYKRGIDVINRALKDFVAQDDAVTYLDCGPALLPDGKIQPELMPDALHPNADGMELFAKCLSPVVDKLMTKMMR